MEISKQTTIATHVLNLTSATDLRVIRYLTSKFQFQNLYNSAKCIVNNHSLDYVQCNKKLARIGGKLYLNSYQNHLFAQLLIKGGEAIVDPFHYNELMIMGMIDLVELYRKEISGEAEFSWQISPLYRVYLEPLARFLPDLSKLIKDKRLKNSIKEANAVMPAIITVLSPVESNQLETSVTELYRNFRPLLSSDDINNYN
jgi:hypothetical protein